MSIYATLPGIKVEKPWAGIRKLDLNNLDAEDEWIEITLQGVRGHIGHPEDYPEGDPYGSFLPPPIQDYDGLRAVVVLGPKNHTKKGQRYVKPLFVLTGQEYAEITWCAMLERITEALWEHGYGTEHDG